MSSVWYQALSPGQVALEGEPDGKLRKENEHLWFAEMISNGIHFPELEKATSWEFHDQWGIKIGKTEKNAAAGQVRVRGTYPGGEGFMNLGEPKFTHAVKINAADGGAYENEIEVTKEYFDTFRYLADNGMQKDRYFFPVEGGVFEVDMFLLPGLAEARLRGMKNRGRDYHFWCKIDYEVTNFDAPIPAMPFKVKQLIKGGRGIQNTPEETALLDNLFKEVYTTPNPLLKK